MGLIIDAIVILIIAVCIILGVKKGLIKSLLSVVAFLAAVFISFNCSQFVANFINNSFIEPNITKKILQNIESESNDILSEIPRFVINNKQLNEENIQKDFYENQHLARTNLANLIVENNVSPVVVTVLTPICSVVLFLLLSSLFSYIAGILNKVIKVLPVGLLNKIGGALLGGIKGIVFSVIFCLIIASVIYFNENGLLLLTQEAANGSYFYKLFINLLV